MTTSSVISMILILSIVIGSFLYFLRKAINNEKKKKKQIMYSKMDTIDPLNNVAAFHKLFKVPILTVPTLPSKERCNLRISLIEEELDELKEGIEKKDIVEIADALCDLQYVLSGAVLEFGLGEKFSGLFDEVQRSNMSKACSNESEVQKTLDHYLKNHNTEAYYQRVEDKYVVYRTKDNKVLKSVNYSKPDFDEKALKAKH